MVYILIIDAIFSLVYGNRIFDPFMWLYVLSSSATNRLITAKDHASVQINIGHLDDRGVYNGAATTFALSGFVRAQVLIVDILTG